MSGTVPRKHHTVTAGYLRRYAIGSQVAVHRDGDVATKGVRGVGYVRDLWGSPEVAIAMEARLAELENRALDVLAALPTRWPLLGKNRSALGAFMAMHIVRMPSYGALVRQMGERATRDVLSETEHDLDAEQIAEVEAWLRGDGVHADTLWRHVVRFASFLCSMHWTLVEVERDWLITGDQPVVLLPPVPQPITPASALLPAGLSYTLEGRFTLDPRRAVLMTWSEDPEERWVSGSHAQACSINFAIKAQALQEWFSLPGTTPPLLSPPLLQEWVYPISQELLPGYTVPQAGASGRRAHAERIVREMVEGTPQNNKIRWVRVTGAEEHAHAEASP